MFSSARRRIVAAAAAIVAGNALLGTWIWLQQQHAADQQIELADTFILMLRTHRVAEAYELTLKTRMELPTKEEFAVFASRQICGSFKMTEVFPFQSNGNRLRRWLLGQNVEMDELNIQYFGECAFRVTLRKDTERNWKVFKFGSHAY
jgi:hypothetical protein